MSTAVDTAGKLRAKVCGLTRYEDAIFSARHGAWALGFIFHPASPRVANPAAVGEILETLRTELRPGPAPLAVGVFVDAGLARIREVHGVCAFDRIQLHGDESLAECRSVSQALALPVIKALRLGSGALVSRDWIDAARGGELEALLVDAQVPGEYGGTGKLADWDGARALAEVVPVILAGGLDGANVEAAKRSVAPWAIDASSKLEMMPGIKDTEKLRRYLAAAGRSE